MFDFYPVTVTVNFETFSLIVLINYSFQILQNSNLIGAWNNHFLVMAGKKFTDIFAADRLPPVLSGLVYKQNRLEKQLEDFPELPPIRDSTYKVLYCLVD